MKKVFLMGAMFSAVLWSCSKDNEPSSNINKNVSAAEQTFLAQAAISNLSEIQAGQLAASNATNASVKSFGQLMVTEHTKAQTDLSALATRVNYSLSDSIDAEHRAIKLMLDTLTGRSFDSAYISNQVKDHQRTLALFQAAQTGSSNQQVRTYANTYAAAIKMHLDSAVAIQARL